MQAFDKDKEDIENMDKEDIENTGDMKNMEDT